MALRFVGIDPDSSDGEGPTVWVDEERQELVLQGVEAQPRPTWRRSARPWNCPGTASASRRERP